MQRGVNSTTGLPVGAVENRGWYAVVAAVNSMGGTTDSSADMRVIARFFSVIVRFFSVIVRFFGYSTVNNTGVATDNSTDMQVIVRFFSVIARFFSVIVRL